MTDALTAERRAGLLARAVAEEVIDLAERVVAHVGAPTILAGPDVGMVMLQVREPVADERFHLGEVVVTSAEVDLDGARGWSMRMGRDRVATLAAAVCDAAAELMVLADEIDALCRPAGAVGLDDRGRLEPGTRGDVVVVSIDCAWPTVRFVGQVADAAAVPA